MTSYVNHIYTDMVRTSFLKKSIGFLLTRRKFSSAILTSILQWFPFTFISITIRTRSAYLLSTTILEIRFLNLLFLLQAYRTYEVHTSPLWSSQRPTPPPFYIYIYVCIYIIYYLYIYIYSFLPHLPRHSTTQAKLD